MNRIRQSIVQCARNPVRCAASLKPPFYPVLLNDKVGECNPHSTVLFQHANASVLYRLGQRPLTMDVSRWGLTNNIGFGSKGSELTSMNGLDGRIRA